MAECEATVGLERVRCFHLNDCKKPLGCRVDRHEEVGKGSIGRVAFQCLVNDPRFVNTIGVLETPFPERYGETLRLLESLRRRTVKEEQPCQVQRPSNTRRALPSGDGAEPASPRLAELPARDKLERLMRVAKGKKRALILTHDNPDPDSMAAAVALAHILERRAGVEARVGYGGIIGRAENIAFVKVLRLPVSHVSQMDLRRVRSLGAGGHAAAGGQPLAAVADPRGHRGGPPPAARGEPSGARSRTWAGTSAPPRRCWWSTCARRGWSPRWRWPPRSSTASRRTRGTWAARRPRRTWTATCGCSRAVTSSCWGRSSTRSCRRATSSCTTRPSSGRRCTAPPSSRTWRRSTPRTWWPRSPSG